MKFWTTQSDDVLHILLKEKIYEPDFEISKKMQYVNMCGAYDGILEEYKSRNNIFCKGLLFGISELDNMQVSDINQYRNYFRNDTTFWDSISKSGDRYTVLELNLPDSQDYIPINFQDFIIIGARALHLNILNNCIKDELLSLPFTYVSEDIQIAQNIGWTKDGSLENIIKHITQVHYHQLKLEDVIGVYSTIDYENKIEYSLSDTAKRLLDYVIT